MTIGRTIQVGSDNINVHKESAIKGHAAGYEGVQMAAFQRGPGPWREALGIDFASRKTLKVPEVLHEIKPVGKAIVKCPPYLLSKEDVAKIFDPPDDSNGSFEFNVSSFKDFCFLFYRMFTDVSTDPLANWANFHKHLRADQKMPASEVGLFPLLNAKADDHDAINTVGDRVIQIAKMLNLPEVWLINDQAVFAPNYEVKWTRGPDWKNLYNAMGGLHIICTFLATIGNHMQGSELEELWVEAGITTSGIADKVMRGKDYKAGMTLHGISWRSGFKVILKKFLDKSRVDHPKMMEDLEASAKSIDDVDDLFAIISTQEFQDVFTEFIDSMMEHKTFKYYMSYLDMLQTLFSFSQGQRGTDWDLYHFTFKDMLDYMMR
jgi:hypothetical protein